DAVPAAVREQLQESLVVVHGGLAANVGPILEMVTEKFLLGTTREWEARMELLGSYERILSCLRTGDIREFGRITTSAFQGPLQAIVPWVSNFYTERLIAGAREAFGERFWGFWMMGGMSGGGMGFIFDPTVRSEAEAAMLTLMRHEKASLEHSLPFAMDPVVYRVAINENGTHAELRQGTEAVLSAEYYLLMLPRWLHDGSRTFSPSRRRELEAFSSQYLSGPQAESVGKSIISRLFPASPSQRANHESLDELLDRNGFDREQHERVRSDLLAGRIGLMKNRLPADTLIEEIRPGDAASAESIAPSAIDLGRKAIERGEVAVVTLAAGAGSRWTQGAGTVKALHPFAKLQGRFRTFVEVHLAKSRQAGRVFGLVPAHVFTTSYLTHAPIQALLQREHDYGLQGRVMLSPGRSIGLRFVPTARDLAFAWQAQHEQKLEERKQKVRDSARKALIDWAVSAGEASDYRDNLPLQCLHPVGHWYEVANLLLNGSLKQLLDREPNLKYLLLHNIDTLGAALDPVWLGAHIESGAALSFEVVQRRLEDRGGGLARVAGRLRLVEGLALPREEDEARLSCYNSLTTWISIQSLLSLFGLTHSTLSDPLAVRHGVRALAARLPTYITLKEVKRRWGNAQEDVFTVAQFERLWGDMSAVPEARSNFFVVPRARGQQLKDVAQLDGWVRDGSRDFVEAMCDFEQGTRDS
ncbi:MAG TPA: UTP--glucose-1-phosphate uridylyltransferase, partial [Polyangiaceae bacterium]|nr:UTP--glucose-1-phosphate uridylyltransferase [Polyangiaceae bacterium]